MGTLHGIGNLIKLEDLNMGTNGLTGSIPDGIFDLTSLAWLSLGANNFTGTLQPGNGNLTNTRQFVLLPTRMAPRAEQHPGSPSLSFLRKQIFR